MLLILLKVYLSEEGFEILPQIAQSTSFAYSRVPNKRHVSPINFGKSSFSVCSEFLMQSYVVSASLIRVRRLQGERLETQEQVLSSPATSSCGPRHLDLKDRISNKKWVVVIKVFGWEEILTTDLQVQKLKFYHCATP